MKRALLFATLAATAIFTAAPQDAEAQSLAGFSLRAGADLRPILFTGPAGGGTIGDFGYLGITAAPGFKLVEVLTLELALTPLIPLTGDPVAPDFQLLISPGVIVDLLLVYVRGALPFEVTNGHLWLEAAAGISFLSKGYLGLTLNYAVASELLMMGAEIGFRF